MIKYLIIAVALFATCTSPVFANNKTVREKAGPKSPLGQARKHLENALAMISAKEEGGKGGKGKKRANLPNIVTALNEADVCLKEAKIVNGIGVSVALKFIADAKTEIEASKDQEGDHMQKAVKAIDEALKRVMQAIQAIH